MHPILRGAALAWLLGASLTAAADYRLTLPKHGLPAPAAPAGPAVLSLDPASTAFGAQVVGQSATAAVTLSNVGGTAASLTLVGPNAPFSFTSACPGLLAPAASCTLSLRFDPSARGDYVDVLTVLGGTGPLALPLSGSAQLPALLGLTPATLDLGSVPVGQTQTATAVLANTGDLPAALGFSAPPAPFSLTHDCPAELPAQAQCTLTMQFAPSAQGATTGSLGITGGSGPLALALAGYGLAPAALAVTPASVDFGTVATGSTASVAVTLTNTGEVATPVTVTSPTAPFSVVHACPASLAPGANCVLNAQFSPTASGARTDALSVTGSTDSVTVALGGTGQVPATLSATPSSLAFGSVYQGASSTLTLAVTNTGDVAAEPIFGGLAAPFTFTEDCPVYLAPAASCTVNVTYTPTVQGSASDALNINGGAAPVTVAVSGSAPTAAVLSLSTSSVAFGNVNTGSTGTASVTLTNTGGSPATLGFSGPATPFGMTENCAAQLMPSASCTLSMSFSPTTAGSFNGSLTVTGGASPLTLSLSGAGQMVSTCVAGKTVFAYTGGLQTFTMPAGCSAVTVKAWGAGGGGINSIPFAGGGGGYAKADFALNAGGTLSILVAGGGNYGNTSLAGGYGGGGVLVYANGYNASGGGASQVRTAANTLILVAAGGGGASDSTYGGAGGGTVGQDGTGAFKGYGGTQTAGGATTVSGPTAGAFLQGGKAGYYGAGGGGGYYGGGGAGGGSTGNYSGGGGGSSWAHPTLGSSIQLLGGNQATPGNSGDADRAGAAQGGTYRAAGANGRVVVEYR